MPLKNPPPPCGLKVHTQKRKHENKFHTFIVYSCCYQLHHGCLTLNTQVFRSPADLRPTETEWDLDLNSFEHL